jgi:hypothetical protein
MRQPFLFDVFNGIRAIEKGGYVIAMRRQVIGDEFADIGVIFDYQDLRLVHCGDSPQLTKSIIL